MFLLALGMVLLMLRARGFCFDCGIILVDDDRCFCKECLSFHKHLYRLENKSMLRAWRVANHKHLMSYNKVYIRKRRILDKNFLKDVENNPRKYLDRVSVFSHVPLRTLRNKGLI